MLSILGKSGITALVVLALVAPATGAQANRPVANHEFVPIHPAHLQLEAIEIDLDPIDEPDQEPEAATEPKTEAATDCDLVPCIALTFDDGPHQNTLKILASLKKAAAKATFFVVGSAVRSNPEIALQIVSQGHEIAAHSNTHKNLAGLSKKALRQDFSITNKTIEKATGFEPKLFRPPFGSHTSQVRQHANLPVVMWSVDPQDWRVRSSRAIAKAVLNQATPGAIVVLHDPLTATSNALPTILRELGAQGYHFVTVSELLGETEPGKVYRSR